MGIKEKLTSIFRKNDNARRWHMKRIIKVTNTQSLGDRVEELEQLVEDYEQKLYELNSKISRLVVASEEVSMSLEYQPSVIEEHVKVLLKVVDEKPSESIMCIRAESIENALEYAIEKGGIEPLDHAEVLIDELLEYHDKLLNGEI